MRGAQPKLERLQAGQPAAGGLLLRPGKLFFIVFLAIALLGTALNFSRATLYESRATLLTSAKTAIDQMSDAADIQHVAIQRQRLLSDALLVGVTQKLAVSGLPALNPQQIREYLQVRPIADTNLVEMVAQGAEPELLPALINHWVTSYTEARELEILNNRDATTAQLSTQIDEMQERLDASRDALTEFRRQHDIVSAEREENAALSRLSGLNKSLNKAFEAETVAESELESLREAIARKEQFVPEQQRGKLRAMEKERKQLQTRLAALDLRYTREYLALQPTLSVIPGRIEELERAIGALKASGSLQVLDEARQRSAAAKLTRASLEQQLAEHKQKVSEFTAIFDRHRALQRDLENLEKLNRTAQSRLLKVQTSQVEKYPQVDVVASPHAQAQRIGPPHGRDTLIVMGLALLAGLFAVWLARFLQPAPATTTVTVTGAPLGEHERLAYQAAEREALEQQRQLALAQDAEAIDPADSETRAGSDDNEPPEPGAPR